MIEQKEGVTAKHLNREKIIKEDADREKNTKVVKEWYEVAKRNPHEDGKLLVIRITNNGYKHREYIGKESKCKDFIEKLKKEGKLKEYKG